VCEENAIEHSTQGKRGWPIQVPVLLAAHVLLLLAATWFRSNSSPNSIADNAAISVFPAQACLIGIWLGARRSTVLWRWAVAAAGIGLVGMALAHAQWSALSGLPGRLSFYTVKFLGLVAVLTTLTAVLVLGARKWYNAVLVSNWRNEHGPAEGFRFGVRHLLIVTFVVAMLLGLRGAASHSLRESEEAVGPFLYMLFFGVAWGAPCLVVLWATLGPKRLHERLAVALVCVFLVAMLTPPYDGVDWRHQDFWKFALVVVAMFAIVIVSLLIVRSARYRLVQDLKHDSEPATIADA
jgi:hypothetical protein